MNNDEYNKLFHELNLNLVAFKPLMECNQEVLKLVNAAIAAEREACARLCEEPYDLIQITDDCSEYVYKDYLVCADAIRARGQQK